jgi:hypothetical protein
VTDGLSRVAGVGGSITLGGKSWQVRGKTLEYYASLEAEIIKTRGSNPFEMIVESATILKNEPEILRQIIRELAQEAKGWRFVKDWDFFDFLSTPRGRSMHLWLSIKHNEGAPSKDDCHVQYMREVAIKGTEGAQAWQNEIDEAIRQASGEGPLGNSTGLSAPAQAEQQTGG